MTVIERLSRAAARGTRAKFLLLSLVTLIWRMSDLADEAISGTPKMSLATWHITGGDAVAVQIVLVGVLASTVFAAYNHMRQESATRANRA
jgi:hypothetical protein